jgi:predicted Zn finger-like uncharacterized protein
MSDLTISCPHCGFSKNVEKEKIPAGVKSIRCPKCKLFFALERGRDAASRPLPVVTTPRPAEEPTVDAPAPKANAGKDFLPPGQVKFCSACGQKIHDKAEICPHCGVRVAPPPHAVNKVALLLITFFLGGLGGHRFYQKKYGLGILYLLFFWTYIPSLVALVEFFIYAFKSEDDLQRKYPEASSGGAVFAIAAVAGIAIIGILAAIAIPQFAAYREKAFNATASSDLRACKTEAESYYADNGAYPTAADQIQCHASKDVALYYLSLGPDKYQLISFHDKGRKAFLNTSDSGVINENMREEIERQIGEKFGPAETTRTFHFLE